MSETVPPEGPAIEFPPEEREAPPDYEGPTWTTEDGRRIAIVDLNDQHLLNNFEFLDRQICEIREATSMYFHPVWGPRGEMAQFYSAQEMERIWDRESVLYHMLKVIQAEIERRALPVPQRKIPEPPPEVELVEDFGIGQVYRILPPEEKEKGKEK